VEDVPVTAGPALQIGFLGYAARLAEPRALWLLAAVGALAALAAASLLLRRAALRRAAGSLAPRLAPGAGLARPAARQGLALLGLALLAVALARPQCGSRAEITRRSGVDLAVVLDASRSMLARDVLPDRLGRAKLEVGSLLDGLAGDRVALVVFAAEPFVQCPLTTDYEAARVFLRAVGPDSIPSQGTDVGAALSAAADVLHASSGTGTRTRVVLLVSDGEDNEGSGVRTALALADEGVRVYALALGDPAGAPIPGQAGGAPRRDRAGNTVVTRRDDAVLRAIAGAGGGEVFEVGPAGRGVEAFRAALGRLERSEIEGRVTVSYEDRYALAAYPAFLAILAALLLREARRTRPEEAP
jgi:Ca-activated chloride channel family protein